ncbi:MAG TPA: hypothetical protein DIU15_09920 [Deltaproteobacteria bacterium]|nr:hypothetical protein [Deltaproteobacteria bacterium]HCP46349.1 hypothetical protein [Deltaproteobacteria bacterium]|tara:strand:+ start:1062 stop:1952 length:891 start_codon:yes stop_codon:yes gene_type:complete
MLRATATITLGLLFCMTAMSCGGSVTAETVARCDGIQQPNETTVDSLYDLDGDGFFDASDSGCAFTYDAAELDCNDSDPLIHPEAGETACNDLDDDCNELTTDFVDLDEDESTSCFDCDDSDPTRSPDLIEVLCNGIDDDCEESSPDEVDEDSDGSSSCEDCDDNDPGRYPGLPEVECSGIDEDCDGTAYDPGIDEDQDGVTTCGADGIADTPDDDCSDNNPDNFPGNTELCDGQDNDCQFGADAPEGELDMDSDGYLACEDCNDEDGSLFPGNPEVCNDGNDQDCSGVPDDGPDC